MGVAHQLRHRATLLQTSRRRSRLALAGLGVLTLLLAACAPGGADQPGLAKDQTFTWPYVSPWGNADQPNDPGNVFGGPNAKGHAAVLDPAVVSYSNDMSLVSLLYAPLVAFDSQAHLVNDAASKIDVSPDAKVYTFHLRQNLKFSDGTPLQAADYAYSIDRALDPTICNDGGPDAKTYGPAAANSCYFGGPTYLGNILGADARINGNGGNDHSVVGQGDDPNHGVDVLDPYTLRVTLKNPAAYFLGTLTYPTAFPVKRALVEKYPGGLWVDHLDEGGASGPFTVKSYNDGKTLSLVPNTYWEQAYGKQLTLTELDRPIVFSTDDEYANYRAGKGNYDYTDIPLNKYFNAQSQDGFHEVPVLQTDYFGLNFQRAPFDNQNVRQAFAMALNKQLLVDTVENGGALPTNHIVPRGMPGFNQNLLGADGTTSITGNKDTATKQLQVAIDQCNADAKANTNPYTGVVTWPEADDFCPYIVNGPKSKEIDFMYKSSNQTRQSLTKGAVQNWQSVLGLNVQAKAGGSDYSHNVNSPAAANPYQAWIVGWVADYPDPQDFLSLQFRTGMPNNTSGMSDAKWDSLVDQADREPDAGKRMDGYNQAEQQAVATFVPWIPLLQPKAAWFTRPWVKGFGLSSQLLILDTDWANVSILSH